MQAAHEKKVALRNPIAGFSPSQQVRFFITFKLNPRRVRAALTRRGPWPGGDHVLRGDRQKSPGLCNREHIAPKPLSMDYDGSDCTCIHSPSSVSLIHLFFMGPLTFSYKPAHSLTHSQLLSSTRSSFPSLPVSPLLTSLGLTSRFTKRYEYLLTTRDQTAAFCPCARAENTRFETFFFFPLSDMFHHSTLLCPYGFTVTHRGQRALLICAIDFLIGSAPRLVNENML